MIILRLREFENILVSSLGDNSFSYLYFNKISCYDIFENVGVAKNVGLKQSFLFQNDHTDFNYK